MELIPAVVSLSVMTVQPYLNLTAFPPYGGLNIPELLPPEASVSLPLTNPVTIKP
jgi:hypothetical protein